MTWQNLPCAPTLPALFAACPHGWPHPSPRPRGAAVTSPVSACDCHLSPRPRPRDLPDPNCPRCRGSGEVTCG